MQGKYKIKPYKHQLDCLNKFGRKPAFALLAEMGTGKTKIIIDNIADLWSSNDCDAAIIFAPNGVHTNWTRLELPKHMPEWVRWKSAAYASSPRKDERLAMENLYSVKESNELRILTMNWEALQTKKGFEAAINFCNCSMKLMIVCDESDAIKNPTTARAKALMKLKKFSKWRRIMTGTPINNSPFDAFSQFNFLDENILLTPSFYAFKTEYAELMDSHSGLIQNIAKKKTPMPYSSVKAIQMNIDELQTIINKNGREELETAAINIRDSFDIREYNDIIQNNQKLRGLFNPTANSKKARCLVLLSEIDNIVMNHINAVSTAANSKRMPQIVVKDKKTNRPKYKNLDKLSKLIAPHSFRILKSECLDLPDKIYKTVTFKLSKKQQDVYDKAKKECRVLFEGNETVFTKLVAVTKLAQITSGYCNISGIDEPMRIDGENPKIEMLVDRVNAIREEGNKVIIWARYTEEIKDITEALIAEGFELGEDIVQYYGEVKKQARVDAIENFENGSASIFIGNQAAGGTGITLVAASYMIYFSNSFSLRDRLQSEDRAHRIGQIKNVTYINIVAENTIDELVVDALVNKKDVADTIIDKGLKYFGE